MAVAVALLAGGCSSGDERSEAAAAADAYLSAWAAGDLEAMSAAVAAAPADFAARQQGFRLSLGVATIEPHLGDVSVDGDRGAAPFEATLGLQGVGTWAYEGSLDLVRDDGGWKVDWSPAALHPALADAAGLRVVRHQGYRGQIVAAGGQPLTIGGPGEATRRTRVGGSVIGTLRVIDAAEASRLGLQYAGGDLVGAGGIEEAYEHRLAGEPVGRIVAVDGRGGVLQVLHEFGAGRPDPLGVTLDPATQTAAEEAVAGQALPTALVAVDSTTGAIRAIANNPSGYDRALLGQYPPGSTFKIVTGSALLARGYALDTAVECPAETRPGDSAPFVNADGHDLGTTTFLQAFAQSCNTTFVDLGFRVGGPGLQEEAEEYGFNQPYSVGLPTVGASYPLPESDTELAASAIGQGRVSVTPLHMATVAAAAYDGTWRPPYLSGEPATGGTHDLPEAELMPEMMREVVRTGTGVNAAVPGRDVGGKTGTAEFGDEDPPETHAWFVGFVGELAYAVVVEGGGVGGEVAAPIASHFISLLPAPPAGPGALPSG